MTRNRRLMIVTLAAAALLAGYLGYSAQRTQAQPARQAEPTAVAVVNVAELIVKCDANVSFQAELQKRQQQLQQDSEDKQRQIQVLRSDLDVIANAQARQEKEREIIQAIAEFRAWQQIQQEYLLRDQRLFLIDLYGVVDNTIAGIAQREGYDIVLFDTPTPDFGQLNPEQLMNAIGNRRVLYRAERVNITTAVLEQMNLDNRNN